MEKQNNYKKESLDVIVPADYRYVSIIRKFITTIAEIYEFPKNDIKDINLAIDEIANNSIEHGYGLDNTKQIKFSVIMENDTLKIVGHDWGIGFDITKYRFPRVEDLDYDNHIRNRGIYLVNLLMDKVEYDINITEGTRVTLFKYLPGISDKSFISKRIKFDYNELKKISYIIKDIFDIGIQIINSEGTTTYTTNLSKICLKHLKVLDAEEECEDFFYAQLKAPIMSYYIIKCPLKLNFGIIPIIFENEKIGIFVLGPVVLFDGNNERDILIQKKSINSYMLRDQNESNQVSMNYDRFDSICRMIFMMVNSVPIMSYQRNNMNKINKLLNAKNEKLSILYDISRAFNDLKLSSGEILNIALNTINRLIGKTDYIYFKYTAEKLYIAEKSFESDKEASEIDIENSLSGWVIKNHKPTLVSDIRYDTRIDKKNELMDKKTRSILCIPLATEKNVFGAISLYRKVKNEETFTLDDLKTASIFISQIAQVLENILYYNEMEKRIFQLSVINEITTSISSIMDINTLLETIVNRISDLMLAEKCSIMLADKNNKLLIKAATGLPEAVVKRKKINIDNSTIAGWVVKENEALFVTDISKDNRFKDKVNKNYVSNSFISVPLLKDKTCIGVLNITDKVNGEFEDTDFDLLKLIAKHISIVLSHALELK